MRILIAGLGAIGQRHARNLRAICGADLELLALRSRRMMHVITESLERDATRDVEADLGIEAFDTLETALDARPDAVFICTPSSRHMEAAQAAAERGCHLFIEKPLSHTLDGVGRLRDTIADKHVVALVGCQWRYHPCVRWLKSQLERRAFGQLARARIEYAEYLPDWHPYEDYRTSYAARADLGGGVVLTQVHDYDLAWWLFGHPHRVRATGGHLSDLDIDVEDTVDALLDGGDAPVSVRQSFACRPPRRVIAVEGDGGSATIDLLAGRVTTAGRVTPPCLPPEYRRNEMFIAEARHFLDCMAGRSRPAVPLEDGIAVLRLALGVKAAMASGREIEVD